MHLIYLDESGNTGTRRDPDQPIHLIAGLCIRGSDILKVEADVLSIVRKHFDVLMLTPDFVLHAVDLYSGNGFFRGIAPAVRIACINDIFDALAANNAAVIWAAVDKMKLYTDKHPHQLAFPEEQASRSGVRAALLSGQLAT